MSNKEEVYKILQRYGYEEIVDEEKPTQNDSDKKGRLIFQANNKLFLQLCREYYQKNGHLQIPAKEVVEIKRDYREPIKFKLGNKMQSTRRLALGKVDGCLPTELVEELDKIDPYWVNREVSIKDMQKEKVQRENIKSQTRA